MPTALRLSLRIDDDGLAAWIRVGPGPAMSREALLDFLSAARVTTGLDEDAIARVANGLAIESAALEEECIARGRAPRDPTPDRVELAQPIGPTAGSLRDDESVDYRERCLIVPVKAGDRIGEIVRGIPGEPGIDVHGNTRPCAAVPALVFSHGDGITLEDDGSLRAARTGARSVDKQGRVDVVALHVHAAAVDLASGNLETAGSLEISRDVTAGMSVRAAVDLAIKGTVEAARVEAGGSIVINGGVIGGDTGVVRAGGHLTVRHALGARLICGGTLEITKNVSTSELRALEIEIGGSMLGDRAFAETRIEVRDAGSPAGGPCHLRAAHPFDATPADAMDRSAARELALAKLRGGERLAKRKSREVRTGRGERPTAPPAAQLVQQRSFRKRQRALQGVARIVVTGTAHAGCRIDFGGRPLVLETTTKAKSFQLDIGSGEIVAKEI